MKLDHVIISVNDLTAAIANYREHGFVVTKGGRHSSGTTENALIAFSDGAYIELIAPTGEERSGDGMDYRVLVSKQEGYTGFALFSSDLDTNASEMTARGLSLNAVAEGSRQKPSGEVLKWKSTTIPDTMSPFFVQDITPRELRVSNQPEDLAHDNGAMGIVNITVLSAPDAVKETVQGYRNITGADPKLSDGAAVFQMDGFTITVQTTSNEGNLQHIEQRGRAPYEIGFSTRLPYVAPLSIHGAKMRFDT